jgi:hypothetical protein
MTEATSAEVGAELPKGVGLWKSELNLSVISNQFADLTLINGYGYPDYFCLQTKSRAISPKLPSTGAPN